MTTKYHPAAPSLFCIFSICRASTTLRLSSPPPSSLAFWSSSRPSSPGSSAWWRRRGRLKGHIDPVPRSSPAPAAWWHRMRWSYQRRKDSFEIFCLQKLLKGNTGSERCATRLSTMSGSVKGKSEQVLQQALNGSWEHRDRWIQRILKNEWTFQGGLERFLCTNETRASVFYYH